MTAPLYIEKAVAAALKASPAVNEICGRRVYPLKVPQGNALPAVVYQRIYSSPDYTLLGYTTEGVLLLVNCFSKDYEEAKDLALAVRATLAAQPINALLRNERDLPAGDDVFCVSAEYLCRQTGGYCYG